MRHALLLAAILCAAAAHSEVRIVAAPGGPTLQVQATRSGPWSARGPQDRGQGRLLNPTGDLLGDGFPGNGTDGLRLTAAWLRPLTSEVVIVSAEPAGQISPELRALTPVSVGTPRVVAVEGGALIFWQGIQPGTVLGLAASRTSTSDVGSVQEGILLDAATVGGKPYVISWDEASRTIVVGEYVALLPPHPIPIPQALHISRIQVAQLVAAPTVERVADGLVVAWSEGPGRCATLRVTTSALEGPISRRGSCRGGGSDN